MHKILNKIRVNSNRIPLRQEEDNLSVRVKAERRIAKAAGLTPRDYPVRWVHFSRLRVQPVASPMSNHGARGSAETGDVKTLLGDMLSPRQRPQTCRHCAGVMPCACVTDATDRPTDRVDEPSITCL